mmetsp:Transcript_58265/g.109059  ORF Transcript_58265/g.109059 Transcript_58265/m.109059 type:complete len:251 (+) Transcript_58265:467-1219(+)
MDMIKNWQVLPLGLLPLHVTGAKLRGARLGLIELPHSHAKTSKSGCRGKWRVALFHCLLVCLCPHLSHACFTPWTPIHSDEAARSEITLRALLAPECRQLIQQRICRAIIHLPRVAEERRGGREAHCPAQRPAQLLSGAQESHEHATLGLRHLSHPLLRHASEDPIVQHPSQMQDPTDVSDLSQCSQQVVFAVHLFSLNHSTTGKISLELAGSCSPQQHQLVRLEPLLFDEPGDNCLSQATCRPSQEQLP